MTAALRTAAVVLALTAAACGTPGPPPAGQTLAPPSRTAGRADLPVGATLTWDDRGARQAVQLVSVARQTTPFGGGNPPAHGVYVTVTIAVEQLTAGESPDSGYYNATSFEWVRPDGTHDQWEGGGSGDGWLNSGNLLPGQTARGTITFDTVPGPGRVEFTGGLTQTGSWSVPG